MTICDDAIFRADQQRNKLASVELPGEMSSTIRASVREAIDGSFVAGFRTVMLVGAALAVGSAVVALWLIGPKRKTISAT